MICVQYGNNVVGPGSPTFDNAYFEVNYVRAYTTGEPQPTSTSASTNSLSTTASGAGSAPATFTGVPGAGSQNPTPPSLAGTGSGKSSASTFFIDTQFIAFSLVAMMFTLLV